MRREAVAQKSRGSSCGEPGKHARPLARSSGRRRCSEFRLWAAWRRFDRARPSVPASPYDLDWLVRRAGCWSAGRCSDDESPSRDGCRLWVGPPRAGSPRYPRPRPRGSILLIAPVVPGSALVTARSCTRDLRCLGLCSCLCWCGLRSESARRPQSWCKSERGATRRPDGGLAMCTRTVAAKPKAATISSALANTAANGEAKIRQAFPHHTAARCGRP